jgi:hypothetical protein
VSACTFPSLRRFFGFAEGSPDFSVRSDRSTKAGFFRLGPDTVLFGKFAGGTPSNDPRAKLNDVSRELRVNGTSIELPFDPEEIIQNLRQERYVAASPRYRQRFRIARDFYYMARPWLPLAVRKRLQQIYLRGWEKQAFPKWPVDRTVDRVFEQMLVLMLKSKGIESIPFIWFWPNGANACAVMTHDVEAEPGKRFCSQLMDIDEAFGIPASFQIVPQDRYSVEPRFLDEIRTRGFEINVQDLNHDGKLFLRRSEFEHRVKAINGYGREYGASGFRSAVLYRNQEWVSLLEFEYDMSVPNVAHLDPQRGGCCTIMPYFVGELLELPVTMTQDYSLSNILNDFSLKLWQRQSQCILRNHGLMNFIIHPDYMLSEKAQQRYKSLLTFLTMLRVEEGLWIALPNDVNRWWRQRDQMMLRRKGQEWLIEGEGSERASVAYAIVENDRLVYSLTPRPQTGCLFRSQATGLACLLQT